jgi:serum/glucocorticoid-regulated kinase 2
MSWLRGKKGSVSNLKAERSSTPTPGNPDGTKSNPRFRTGLLTIRVLWAEGLGVPSGTPIPDVVQKALSSQQAKVAASVSPTSVHQQRLHRRSKGSR